MSKLKRLILGDPLSTDMAQHERIPKWKALAVLSSDALSSVAYATEEVLIPLSIFSIAAVSWSIPIAISIALLLVIVTVSYRQTIDAYPSGGGAYTVAKENLGTHAGLVAAAALLIDYVLTVSVSVAAGVENIISAFPNLSNHAVLIGVCTIIIIAMFNLRGVRESASIFAIPTYLFIFSFLLLIGAGLWRVMNGTVVTTAAPLLHEAYPAIPLFLILRAFSSGCTALTGIEAISNGICIFKEPAQKNAKTTMFWMSATLGFLFLSITALAHVYGIVPKEGETAVSLLSRAVFGDNAFYYLIQASTALILILAANTSYADFPRLASLLAKDRFAPRQLASLGDRLVYSNGIIGLSLAAIFLIIMFKGDTHHLIPLYAVGVFLSFTLSQSGMVIHQWKYRHPGWQRALFFNALGALTTFVVLLVIASTKFIHGAWMVILLIPFFVLCFQQTHKHYLTVAKILSQAPTQLGKAVSTFKNTAIVPVSGIHAGVVDSLLYAQSISKDVRACYVELDAVATERLKKQWEKDFPHIPFIILQSPYRSVIQPLLDYIDKERASDQNSMTTVIIPEFVTSKWYHQFLHNQTAIFLYAALRRRKGVIMTSVRYHLND